MPLSYLMLARLLCVQAGWPNAGSRARWGRVEGTLIVYKWLEIPFIPCFLAIWTSLRADATEAHVFALLIFSQALVAPFAPKATFFDAAKWSHFR